MKRSTVLDRARECVCGDRDQEYGSPENNFRLIADLWNAYLGEFDGELVIKPKDVAMMMALLKIARIKTGFKADSYIDLAGYAACGAEIDPDCFDDRPREPLRKDSPMTPEQAAWFEVGFFTPLHDIEERESEEEDSDEGHQ